MMQPPSSPAPAKSKGQQRLMTVLTIAVLGFCLAAGWMYLRSVRLAREAIAEQKLMAQSSAAAKEDSEAARALTNYLVRIRAQVREHEAAYLRMQQRKALAWNIHERSDIDRDREIIRDFLSTNDRLTDSLQHGEGFIRAELGTAKVPAAVRDSVLERYAKTQKPLLPFQMRVRECDDAIGKNAMAVLDLLNFSWGAWTRDDATGRIDFTNTITLATFKDYVGKIADAANERKQAEDDLINYQKSHPTP